jgi:hypothetical protein
MIVKRTWLLALALVACGGAVQFTLDQDLAEQRVEGSGGGLLGGILSSFFATNVPLTFDIKAETEKRNTGPASAVELDSFALFTTPTAPGGNFDFLSGLDIFVSGPGLSEVKIATMPKLQKGATRIDMTVIEGVNMLPYVNAGAVIRASATGSQPASDVTFAGKVVIRVKI